MADTQAIKRVSRMAAVNLTRSTVSSYGSDYLTIAESVAVNSVAGDSLAVTASSIEKSTRWCLR